MLKVGEANTWPSIPRIRAHCLVETTLDKCVQRLRKRMSEESYSPAGSGDLHVKGKGKLDRTPSFYTSRSILNLSGLSVSDPLPSELHNIITHHETRRTSFRRGSSHENKSLSEGSMHNYMELDREDFLTLNGTMYLYT